MVRGRQGRAGCLHWVSEVFLVNVSESEDRVAGHQQHCRVGTHQQHVWVGGGGGEWS